MSAHRKAGPAVLDGGLRYEPRHRDSASERQHQWALPMRLLDDFYEMRWHLEDEQQREADRVAGEEMRLRAAAQTCTCDGGTYFTPLENAARNPFLTNMGCPFHGTSTTGGAA